MKGKRGAGREGERKTENENIMLVKAVVRISQVQGEVTEISPLNGGV